MTNLKVTLNFNLAAIAALMMIIMWGGIVSATLFIQDDQVFTDADGVDYNSSILANADNAYDLGNNTHEWKDGYFDGTVNTDVLGVDAVYQLLVSSNNLRFNNASTGFTMMELQSDKDINFNGNPVKNIGNLEVDTDIVLAGSVNMSNNQAIWGDNSSGTPIAMMFLGSDDKLHLGWGATGTGDGIINIKIEDDVDMNTKVIENIGSGKSNFTSTGGLVTGDGITIQEANPILTFSETDADNWRINNNGGEFRIQNGTNFDRITMNQLTAFVINPTPGKGVIRLATQSSAPATCTEGELYTDDSGAICYCYTANTWENIGANGACT